MPQTLRWIIAASLLLQIAKCDAIPANLFHAFRYSDQSEIFKSQFWTGISPQTLVQPSGFASNPFGPAGFGRQVTSPKHVLLLELPDVSANHGIGRQRDDRVNATLWRLLKSLIGISPGLCEREWTRECEHSFGNKSYRPKSH
jgi:hypothetical protein